MSGAGRGAPVGGGRQGHERSEAGGVRRVVPPRGGVGKSFEALWAELSEKAATRPPGSGTVARLDAGVHEIGKKLVEEAAESWMAAEFQSREEAAEELSQLLYHVQVMMLALGLRPDDVYRYL